MKKPTYKQLERQVMDINAQCIWALRNARDGLGKAGDNYLTASACVISITALGGREIVSPFAIRDGLSHETIDALIKDIERTCAASGYIIKAKP